MLDWLKSLFPGHEEIAPPRLDTDRPVVIRSPHWPAWRKHYLKVHPACVVCGRTDHLELHHLLPLDWGGGELDETNVRTVCDEGNHGCHWLVGHWCDWHSYNPKFDEWAALMRRAREARPRHSTVTRG